LQSGKQHSFPIKVVCKNDEGELSMIAGENQVIGGIQQEQNSGNEVRQFVEIRLEKELYGIPIEKTREVAVPVKITAIPGTPPHIMGLMNLHGEILSVVDIKSLLNMRTSAPAETSRVVVIKTREGPVGIYCDEVINIYDIMKKDIEVPLSTLSNETGAYVKGQAQTTHGLMGILDIEGLLLKQEK
jgi:purine-binding chemotaxis protein CheW